jgi:hypothetical protein
MGDAGAIISRKQAAWVAHLGGCMTMHNRIGALAAAMAIALGLTVSASAQEPPPPPAVPSGPAAVHHLDGCPDNIAKFENSDATRKLVEKCLGRPASVMKGRGDDVIYQYSAHGGSIILMFVFDRTGAMTHFRAYKHD